jgi:LmbE family N-acetylglucosaminyl deacetylase
LTILIFTAHPDDAIMNMGGTIATKKEKIILISFTRGENAQPLVQKKHVVKEQRRDIKKAADILDIQNTILFSYTDSKLKKELKNPKVTEEIITLIRKYRPTQIFTHTRDDFLFPDHIAVHKAVLFATDLYNAKYAKKKRIELFTFTSWSVTFRNRDSPQLHVDISKVVEKKTEAMEQFQSRKMNFIQFWPYIIIKGIVQGLSAKSQFAENFYKIR